MGVDYLNHSTGETFSETISPVELITMILRQPSSRVRTSLIALFLINPTFSYLLADIQIILNGPEKEMLKIFFSAAVYLQEKYSKEFQFYLGRKWSTLPDFFSEELGIPGYVSSDEKLRLLDKYHKKVSGSYLNWLGSYQSVAHQVLHSFELKRKWNH
jgi:hypothetical protein